jgi:putative ABC transport system substrate-binding protein
MLDLRRRQFITLLGDATAAWPLAVACAATRPDALMHLAADDAEGQARLAAFLQGLQEAG